MPRIRYLDDDDDDILRDGETLRVRMTMMDSALSDRLRVTDAAGSAVGLNRPGFRLLRGGNAGDQLARDRLAEMRSEAYRLADEANVNAWKNPPIGVGSRGPIGQREGDLCMINGFPGHLRPDANGRLTCVADGHRDAMQDERQAAYEEYQRTLENSWRTPA
jgi:hypothetical protein